MLYDCSWLVRTEVRRLCWGRHWKGRGRLVARRRWTFLLLFALLTLVFFFAENLAEDLAHCLKSVRALTSRNVPTLCGAFLIALIRTTDNIHQREIVTCQLKSGAGGGGGGVVNVLRPTCRSSSSSSTTAAPSVTTTQRRRDSERLNAQLSSTRSTHWSVIDDDALLWRERVMSSSLERDYAAQRSEARTKPSPKRRWSVHDAANDPALIY